MMSGNHHFYQLSSSVPPSYHMEGIACYLYSSPGPGRVPLNRFYHPASGAHFYTTSTATPPGWTLEGHEGFVLQSHSIQPASTPLSRFYNPSSDDHYYQTNPQVPKGYYPEGAEGEVFASLMTDGRVPLYRFYNSSNSKHFYSTIGPEAPPGYAFEEVVGFVFNIPDKGRKRLFRYFNSSSGGHFYSLDSAVPKGYVLESEPIYVLDSPTIGQTVRFNRFYRGQSDDHFYSGKPSIPGGYVAEGFEGYLYNNAGDGLVPLYSFFNPDSGGGVGDFLKKVTGDIITGTIGSIIAGPIGFAAGVIFHDEVAAGVSAIGKFTVTGGGSLVGLALFGATLVLAGPGVALTVFIAATAVGNLIIRQRSLTFGEKNYVRGVFGDALPVDNITLTNLTGVKGRFFTVPDLSGRILLNIGDAYDNPLKYLRVGKDTRPGEISCTS